MAIAFDGPAWVAAPRIAIDYGKCQTPMACRKCIQICPQAVFYVRPEVMVKYKENDFNEPGTYSVRPLFMDKCVACDDCRQACPVNAITVTLPQEV